MDHSEAYEDTESTASGKPLGPHHDGGHREDAIIKAIEMRLLGSPHFALRSITTELRQGVIVLRGRVASDYLKFMAQETVRGIEGVSVIINALEVARETSDFGDRDEALEHDHDDSSEPMSNDGDIVG